MSIKEIIKKYWVYGVLGLIGVLIITLLSTHMSAYATGGSTITEKHKSNVNTNTVTYGAGSISVSNVGTMRDFTVGTNK